MNMKMYKDRQQDKKQYDYQIEENCADDVNDKDVKKPYTLEELELHLRLFLTCEHCKRTFIPASLDKHRRACYKSVIKRKFKSLDTDNEEKKYKRLVEYNGGKPILSTDQMIKRHREGRVNWRLKHDHFKQAIQLAQDYVKNSSNRIVVPPSNHSIVESEMKECHHCLGRYHLNAFNDHIVLCKEENIKNAREITNKRINEGIRRICTKTSVLTCPSLPKTNAKTEQHNSKCLSKETYRRRKSQTSKEVNKAENPVSIASKIKNLIVRQRSQSTATNNDSSDKWTKKPENQNYTINLVDNSRSVKNTNYNDRQPCSELQNGLSKSRPRCNSCVNLKSNSYHHVNGDGSNFISRSYKNITCSPIKQEMKIYNHRPFSCGKLNPGESQEQLETPQFNIHSNKIFGVNGINIEFKNSRKKCEVDKDVCATDKLYNLIDDLDKKMSHIVSPKGDQMNTIPNYIETGCSRNHKNLMATNNSKKVHERKLSVKSQAIYAERKNIPIDVLPAYISKKDNVIKYRSTVSLQDYMSKGKNNVKRLAKPADSSYLCQKCGYKYPYSGANFCCSCGSKRS